MGLLRERKALASLLIGLIGVGFAWGGDQEREDGEYVLDRSRIVVVNNACYNLLCTADLYFFAVATFCNLTSGLDSSRGARVQPAFRISARGG